MTADGDYSSFSLFDLFRQEVEIHSSSLGEALLRLEAEPSDPASLETAMRAAHSVKGAGRIVGVEIGVQLAHAMEDCFVAAQEGRIRITSDAVDVLLQATDTLKSLATLRENQIGDWQSGQSRVISRLLESLAAIKGGEDFPKVETIEGLESNDSSATLPSDPASEEAPPGGEPVADDPRSESAPPEFDASAASLANVPRGQRTSTELVRDQQSPSSGASGQESPAEATGAGLPNGAGQGGERSDEPLRVVRVTADNLDRLMALSGESLVEARRLRPFADSLSVLKDAQDRLTSQLQRMNSLWVDQSGEPRDPEQFHGMMQSTLKWARSCRQMLGERMETLEDLAHLAEDLSERLYREAIASRMRPIGDGLAGFPRLVRDLSRELGKNVKLVIVGDRTRADRDILEKLEAPLNHLLRNAVDHGIEQEAERRKEGKPPSGTIRLEAAHVAGMLAITISDDGRGIDPEMIRGKIVDKKLVTEAMAAELSVTELMEFLFLPGFTTTNSVTRISGRGVGLDVVRNMVQEVRGTVRVTSRPGEGTTFQMHLPTTLSVIRAAIVKVADEPYAFPLASIDRIVSVRPDQIAIVEDRQHFLLDGESIGLVSAHQVLQVEESVEPRDVYCIVVVRDRESRYGVFVDSFLGERSLVVRPLDRRLGKVPDILAAALREDGSPLLIIDVEDMIRSVESLLNVGRLRGVRQRNAPVAAKASKRVLVVDDSITVREVQRRLLENHGYEVDVAVDGMDGWNAVRGREYALVISDVDMPRMNGIELVGAIKKDPRLREIPVMIVSYKDREEDRLRGLEAGANYYLAKSSFHDNTLIDKVHDLIGEAS